MHYIYMSSWQTVVKGKHKGSLFISYYTKVLGRALLLFLDCSTFTLDKYHIMLSVNQGGINYHFFESLVWLNLGLNPSPLGPIGLCEYIYIYIYIYTHIILWIFSADFNTFEFRVFSFPAMVAILKIKGFYIYIYIYI